MPRDLWQRARQRDVARKAMWSAPCEWELTAEQRRWLVARNEKKSPARKSDFKGPHSARCGSQSCTAAEVISILTCLSGADYPFGPPLISVRTGISVTRLRDCLLPLLLQSGVLTTVFVDGKARYSRHG